MAAATLKLGCLLLVYFAVTFALLALIYNVQPTPYLDEIFHIPQAQKYCQGIFNEWEEKITTLPGLYLVSVGILVPSSRLLGKDTCDVFGLRCVNLLAHVGLVFVLWSITCKLHEMRKGLSEWKLLVSALNMSTLPVLYFFTFLYYTDVLSTFLVLLMYLLYLEKEHFWGAGIGLVSVVTRQTNIAWVFLVAALSAMEAVKEFMVERNKRLKQKNSKHVEDTSLWSVLHLPLGQLMQLQVIVSRRCFCYLLIGLTFAVFVLANRGVAVGDRSAHEVTLHSPQALYFIAFSCFFALPFALPELKSILADMARRYRVTSTALLAFLLAVHHNTLAHPYLLADNRHYTFYIWRRVFQRFPVAKYILCPAYVAGLFIMYRFLRRKGMSFMILYVLCTALCLVPQKLLEFRYFIVPYLLFRAQLQPDSWLKLGAEFVLNLVVNAATVYLFVERPFYWPHSTDTQRFLW